MADVPTYVSTAVFGLTAVMLLVNVLTQFVYVIKSLKKDVSDKKKRIHKRKSSYPETERL